jgi:hypothetical protein
MRFATIAGLGLAAAALGCAASQSEFLKLDRPDATYRNQTMKFSGSGGSCDVIVYTKFFDVSGNLAACGFASTDCNSREVLDIWFSRANMVLDGQNVSGGGFVLVKEKKGDPFNVDASCIKTKTVWKAAYETTVPRFQGSSVTVRY